MRKTAPAFCRPLYYTVKLRGTELFVPYSERFDGAQKSWLGASTAPWKAVTPHQPLYSSGMHGGNHSLRQATEPLLTEHKANLVLTGHDHGYERLSSKGMARPVGASAYPPPSRGRNYQRGQYSKALYTG